MLVVFYCFALKQQIAFLRFDSFSCHFFICLLGNKFDGLHCLVNMAVPCRWASKQLQLYERMMCHPCLTGAPKG